MTWVFKGEGIPMRCIGIQDRFGQSAHSHEELLEEYGLTARHIAREARELLVHCVAK